MDKNKNAVAVFDKLATLYQSRFMDVSLYAETLDFFCDLAGKDASILELACGPGNITKYLLDRNPQLKILGTDLAPNMLALAKNNNPKGVFEVLDCRDIVLLEQQFDAIMCGFCLPYLSKIETTKLIADATQILNQNGLLYLSTMEDDYEKSGFKKGSTGDAVFQHFYTLDFLVSILEINHFEIIKAKRFFSTSENATATDLVVIAKLRS
ncbi:SAM-dependent methyltransferase [Flavobacterium noncentrifugens]|uniref:Methyltransferase domain-containing protein n=1 Tax=Flavobacterium noncentrifugens TaxID=1128970 RepID=A0A1G9A4L3_9FLAO|nr:class I SAM-dependent methyltransferase [Flavobacterium noncentrifugens]GEP51735.1 SAM-dependent methyltransferase [Flavobacterium noncentrifugens]SDK21535.1 Methyltransferase domain-containing protein [Flavobacterium noncentrifugens]